MKKLALLLIVILSVTSISFAAGDGAYTGGEKTATATFTCKVIAPLQWSETSDVELEEVVAGTTRPYDPYLPINFGLSGEALYYVNVTASGPTRLEDDLPGTVTILGTWFNVNTQQLSTDGILTPYFRVEGIEASSDAHGWYNFTIGVSSVYLYL